MLTNVPKTVNPRSRPNATDEGPDAWLPIEKIAPLEFWGRLIASIEQAGGDSSPLIVWLEQRERASLETRQAAAMLVKRHVAREEAWNLRAIADATLVESLVREVLAGETPVQGEPTAQTAVAALQNIDLEVKAIQMLMDPTIGPNVRRISQELAKFTDDGRPVPRSTLYGWPNFAQRLRQMREGLGKLPSGQRTSNGIEAWRNDPDDDDAEGVE